MKSADFLILLIGPDWFDIFERKADDEAPDWVLFEIETAQENDVDIVPLLLDDTPQPSWDDVAGALADLSRTNSQALTTGINFKADVARISRQLRIAAGVIARKKQRNKLWWQRVLTRGPIQKTEVLGRRKPEAKSLKMVAVMGENVPYEAALLLAMEQRLERQLPALGYKLARVHRIHGKFEERHASDNDPAAREMWANVIARAKQACSDERIDYVVSLATFASKIVRNAKLVSALDARGQIYIGATSPEAAGLVGRDRIAGVRYGTGGTDYAMKFHELFPIEQRLVFLYNDVDGYEQDRGFAAEIAVLNNKLAPALGGRQRFELRGLGRLMKPNDLELADPTHPAASPVYMGWYDLDNMITDMTNRGDPLLFEPRLWVIPSTYTIETIRNFGIVVGVNDEAGGWEAANIVLRHIMKPSENLQERPMKDHGFRVTMRDPVIVRKGLEINPAIRLLPATDPVYRFERRE